MLPSADYIIVDRGYDSEVLREQISDKYTIPVIPIKKNPKVGNDDIDWCLYKYRHLVENVFARLMQYRSIAKRYDKLKRNYEGTRIGMLHDMAAKWSNYVLKRSTAPN